MELLQYIGGETQYVHSLMSLSSASVSHPRLARVGDALRALVNVIKNNPGQYRYLFMGVDKSSLKSGLLSNVYRVFCLYKSMNLVLSLVSIVKMFRVLFI